MHRYIHAGAGEKMQYLVHAFNDNTIRFALKYPGRIDPGALQQATLALVRSVDVLHAAFIPGRLGAKWELCDAQAADCFTCTQAQGDPLPVAIGQALTPIAAADPAKLRVCLVQGETECAMALLASHLCVDGSDGKYLLRKLCEAYRLMLTQGSCDSLQVKNGSRAAEQVYEGLSPQERRTLLRDPRTGVKSAFTFPTDDPGEPAAMYRAISPQVMNAAHERARCLGVTLNDVLLTACYYAYAEASHCQGEPMSIMSMMDLRRHCEGGDSQGLCNLTGALTTALAEGLGTSFPQTLQAIAAQTRRSKEDPFAGLYGMPLLHGAAKRLPMGLLLAAAGRLYGSMAVGLTNVGRIDSRELSMGTLTPTQGVFGGPIKRKPSLQISCASFGDACMLSFWGYASQGDRPAVQQVLEGMAAQVEAFAEGRS